jgi:hypothetical protein
VNPFTRYLKEERFAGVPRRLPAPELSAAWLAGEPRPAPAQAPAPAAVASQPATAARPAEEDPMPPGVLGYVVVLRDGYGIKLSDSGARSAGEAAREAGKWNKTDTFRGRASVCEVRVPQAGDPR